MSGSLLLTNKSQTQEQLAVVASDRWRLTNWNDVEVRAEGPRIRVGINGEQVVDYTDTKGKLLSGRISFMYRAGTEVAVKNARIMRLPSTPSKKLNK